MNADAHPPPTVPTKEEAIARRELRKEHVAEYRAEIEVELLDRLAAVGHSVGGNGLDLTVDRYRFTSLVTILAHGSVKNYEAKDKEARFQTVEVRAGNAYRRLKTDGTIDLEPIVQAIGLEIAERERVARRHEKADAFAKAIGLEGADHSSHLGGAHLYFRSDQAQITLLLDVEHERNRRKLAQLVALLRSWEDWEEKP